MALRSDAALSCTRTEPSSWRARSSTIPAPKARPPGISTSRSIRFTADGALDTTFGTGGVARVDLGAGKAIDEETFITDNAWGLTARAGGYAVNATTPNQGADRADVDYAIVGLTASGQIDSAFGTDGVVVVDLDASARQRSKHRHAGRRQDRGHRVQP